MIIHSIVLIFLFITPASFAQEMVNTDNSQPVVEEQVVNTIPNPEDHLEQLSSDFPDTEVNKAMIDSLELRDMDINDVLKLIAVKTGLNIVSGKDVAGRVSLYVQNIDVHDALSIILDSNGLAYKESKGVIKVMPASEFEQTYGYKFGQKTETKIVVLKAMKAADAASLLMQVKGPLGKVVADESSGTLFLEDVPARLNDMLAYLEKTDVPVKSQVFKINNIPAEGLTTKITTLLTPKIGSASFDANSNKIFVKDTPEKIDEINAYIKQIDLPMSTQVFDISYAKAEDIAKSLTPMLTKDIGRVEFDVRSNSLIVTDIPPKMFEISRVIDSLDKHEQEVLIEARIVQVVLKDESKSGVDWQGILEKAGKFQRMQFTNTYTLGTAVSPRSIAQIGTLANDEYQIVIDAINTMGKSKVLSNPRIAVLNNQEAKIIVGSRRPYVSSTSKTVTSGVDSSVSTTDFLELGITLTVTPTIHQDGFVTMKIKPEVSSANKADDVTVDGNPIPVKSTSELNTTVRVKDGVTIVMGGLIKDEIGNNQSKIPLLGDIPLLGKAFRNEVKTTDKTEIVIFLTPHIITGDVDQVNEQEKLSNYQVFKP